MKKNINLLVGIIVANIVLSASIVYFGYFALNSEKTRNQAGGAQTQEVSRIAILTPVTHQSLEQIEKGFRETLEKSDKKKYEFTTYNANGNKMLLQAQANEIVNGNFDLIFTIGAQSSQLVKAISLKKQKTTPIVFGAVSEPEQLGLVQSCQKPGGNVTGVVETADFKTQIDLLRAIKPATKNILLIYDPTQKGGLEKEKQEVEKIVTSLGLKLFPVEVFGIGEIYPKLQASIAQADVVLVLKDNTVVSAIDSVIKLCNLHHVTLLTTDLDSGDKGAVLSYGVEERQFGVYGAQLARKILEEKIVPATLSCVEIKERVFKINARMLEQQGLVISSEQLLLYKFTKVI